MDSDAQLEPVLDRSELEAVIHLALDHAKAQGATQAEA